MNPRRGFTLLETLLAFAVFALLMGALHTLIFSMGELWGRTAPDRLLREHARAVTHFLNTSLRSSVLPGAAATDAPRLVRGDVPGTNEPFLTWSSTEPPPIIGWPGTPLPDVVLRLHLRPREGLFLLANSRLERVRLGRVEPRPALLSPYVTGIEWEYYDEAFRRWTRQPQPRIGSDGADAAPSRLRLTFEHDGSKVETLVILPGDPRNLP
jgi:prepilin-type N-terminal cleavage/methylation domain-containing protein